MKNKLFKFISPLVLVLLLIGILGFTKVFAAGGTLVVDNVNGVPPTGICIAGAISITGHGTTGQQGSTWHVSINWGDTVTTNATINTGSLTGKASAFTFSGSHTSIGPSTGITVTLYHSQPSGSDGQVVFTSQCVAPPTQGVVNILKHVVNTGGGTAVASNFTLHIASNTLTGSETANSSNSFKLNPSTYTITEDTYSGYNNTSTICIGDDSTNTTNGQVTVVAGHNYTCTVTNTYTPPALCTDPAASNIGSPLPCTYPILGCMDPTATNYNQAATQSDGSCTYPVLGCTNPEATNYNSLATPGNTEATMCTFPETLCKDDSANNYNEPLPCTYPETLCTDPAANNVGSALPCTYPETLCKDEAATNYNQTLPCTYSETLCKDDSANNYNEPLPCTYNQEPTDLCLNIEGIQTTVPAGKVRNSEGDCIRRSSGGSSSGSIPFGFIPEAGRVLGASTSCVPYLNTFINPGDKESTSSEVTKLQSFLNEYLGLNLKVDGIYGKKSISSLKAFQVKNFGDVLDPWVVLGTVKSDTNGTGYVYKTTQRKINLIKCPELDLPMPVLE